MTTVRELIDLLSQYPDDYRVAIEWAPGSGNFSEEVDYSGAGHFSDGDFLQGEDVDDGQELNCVALYPAHDISYYDGDDDDEEDE